jgi:hypothetical protein
MSYYHLHWDESTAIPDNVSSTTFVELYSTEETAYESFTSEDTTTLLSSSITVFISEGNMFLYFLFVSVCLL